MFYKPMLLPLLAQVFLTFVVWFYLYALRIPEIRSKGIDVKDLRDRAESHRLLPVSAAASNNLKNLFEMPVLFYTAILLTLTLLIQDPLLVILSWLYVGLRVVHSIIHTTYNQVMHRFYVFIASAFVLLMIWARLGWLIVIK